MPTVLPKGLIIVILINNCFIRIFSSTTDILLACTTCPVCVHINGRIRLDEPQYLDDESLMFENAKANSRDVVTLSPKIIYSMNLCTKPGPVTA